MADCMEFPKDWAKFLEDYSFCDHKEFYTNGARLISTFRVEQMMDHYLRKATEDAVEVVRCKDCKHWKDSWVAPDSKHEHGFCHLEDADDVVVGRWGDDFCSYGERKDNG